jgi:hypothetical protein
MGLLQALYLFLRAYVISHAALAAETSPSGSSSACSNTLANDPSSAREIEFSGSASRASGQLGAPF